MCRKARNPLPALVPIRLPESHVAADAHKPWPREYLPDTGLGATSLPNAATASGPFGDCTRWG